MIDLSSLSHQATTWTYRVLWLIAILIAGAMPLVIVARGDVLLGPARFDDGHPLDHSAIILGGDVAIDTVVEYPIVIVGGNLTVLGTVHNDVVVVAGNVFLGGSAIVDGDLVTVVGQVYRASGAAIRGTLGGTVHAWANEIPPPPLEHVDLIRQVRLGLATGFGLLLLCLVVSAALPWSIVVTAATARRFPIRSALAAATSVVALPLVLLPLILSLVGLPIAIVISFGALTVWLVGLAAAGYLAGRRILSRQNEPRGFLLVLIVGLAPILLILAIPVFGPLAVGTIGFLGAGARIVSFVERDRALLALESIGPRVN
jgi:hypothetical protein